MLDDKQDALQAVRERAYALWQQAGSPQGREAEFWHRAEAERAPGNADDAEAAHSELELDETIESSLPAGDVASRAAEPNLK